MVPMSRPISARIVKDYSVFRPNSLYGLGMTPADDALIPKPEHRFTFGLWTVGNPGRDPFGGPTREPVDPVDSVRKLAELGAWGISLHDEDLVPHGSSAAERDRIVARFKAALEETGLGVGMATTNLFGQPVFKDGAFTSNDRGVRRAAIGKAMRSIDLGAELNAEVYVFWGGREGTETGVAKDPRDALERYREAINVLCDYVVEQGYDLRFAMEPKPNEPRGDIFLPTVGHALHFISTLDRPDMVGVNPEVAHETMAGPVVPPRDRPGAVGRQAVPRRPQRAGRRPLRPGLPLRRRGPQGGVPDRAAARARRLRRAAPLRRARVPQRGRRGRVGLRARLHAHVPRAGREGAPLRRAARGAGGARRRLDAGAGRGDDDRRGRGGRAQGRGRAGQPRRARASAATTTRRSTSSWSTSCSASAELSRLFSSRRRAAGGLWRRDPCGRRWL